MADNKISPIKISKGLKPYTVAVEGNIGSGKTTFITHFNKFNNVALFSEPIEMWRNCSGHNLLVSIYNFGIISFYLLRFC